MEDPCDWFNMIGSVLTSNCGLRGIGDYIGGLTSLKIYIRSEDNTEEKKDALLNAFNFPEWFNNVVMTTGDLNSNYGWIVVD